MINCYCYNEKISRFSKSNMISSVENISDVYPIFELISPNQNEITEVENLINISENLINFLIEGNYSKVAENNPEYIVSFKLNDTADVMIMNNCIFLHHDKEECSPEIEKIILSLETLWSSIKVPSVIDLDFDCLKNRIISYYNNVYSNIVKASGENKINAGFSAISSCDKLYNAAIESKVLLFNIILGKYTSELGMLMCDEIVSKAIQALPSEYSNNADILFTLSFDNNLSDGEVIFSALAPSK